MTPNDAADAIPDVARDEAGEKLAAVRTLGAGSPVLAFDVGGTDIKSALFDADGRALGLRRTPTPTADGDRTPRCSTGCRCSPRSSAMSIPT